MPRIKLVVMRTWKGVGCVENEEQVTAWRVDPIDADIRLQLPSKIVILNERRGKELAADGTQRG